MQRSRFDVLGQQDDGIAVQQPQVLDAQLFRAQHELAEAWVVHLDGHVVQLRRRGGELRGRFPHAGPDLDQHRCGPAEPRAEVQQARGQFTHRAAEPRPVLLPGTLLPDGHPAAAFDVADHTPQSWLVLLWHPVNLTDGFEHPET